MSMAGGQTRTQTRTLAGATILQIVPALRDDPAGHAALDIAQTLLQAGARALVAGDGGALVGSLRSFGGEWVPMIADTRNPLRLRANGKTLRGLIQSERVDIIHAQCAGAAWSALSAADRMPVWVVTSFHDRLWSPSWFSLKFMSALARGDRVIAPSSYVARAMIERFKLQPDKITVIPRAVDTNTFSPAMIRPENIAAARRAWGVLPNMRVVLTPGRVAPWNGQLALVDAARMLIGNGMRNIAFVLAGDDTVDPRYRNDVLKRARMHGIDTMFRLVGHSRDMATAMAAADIIVIPANEPPLSGRAAAEAQALGRPVIVNAVGMLPENVITPPRMPEHLRTGWLVRPGHPGEMARAIATALELDDAQYDAMGARARQFAEFMFSPQSAADAIRDVYTSLLQRDR